MGRNTAQMYPEVAPNGRLADLGGKEAIEDRVLVLSGCNILFQLCTK